MDSWLDIFLDLGAATVIGAAIGLNRELHHKPTGLKTLSLVALGSALIVLAGRHAAGWSGNGAAESRVIQGVITGLGFLGGGVILRDGGGGRVHGLTTAAAIWVTACLGILCGEGAFRLVLVGSVLVLLVLLFGSPIEKAIHERLRPQDEENPPSGR
jgi:putative Mg2+ transporter-C (MgtC) family protein